MSTIFINIVVLFVCIIVLKQTEAQQYGPSIIPDGYNSDIRPLNPERNTDPLDVTITMIINKLIDTDSVEEHFQIDVTLIESWYDMRLNLSNVPGKLVVTETYLIDRFWLPDLYFINGLSAEIIDTYHSVEQLTINGFGLVNYVFRVNAILSCYMNLQNYPHDHQYCRIKLTPLTHNSSEIRLVWNKFEIHDDEFDQFKVRHWYTADCELWHTKTPENSCIVGTIKLVRRLGYYIIRYYLLTALCVFISFTGFYLPINAWPGRIMFMTLPLLNVITIDISMNDEISVNYVVSLHWWMMWLQSFFYLELCEFALAVAWAHFVNEKKDFAKKLEQARINEQMGIVTDPPLPPHLVGYYFGNKKCYAWWGAFFDRFIQNFYGTVPLKKDPFTRNKMDYMARYVFPFFFVLFIFIYTMAAFVAWSHEYN